MCGAGGVDSRNFGQKSRTRFAAVNLQIEVIVDAVFLFFLLFHSVSDLRCTMHLFVGISSVVSAAQRKLQFGQMYFPRPIFSRRFVFLTSRYREYPRGHFDCLQRCAIPKGQSSQRLVVVNIARAETPSPHRHFIRYKRIPVLPPTYVSPF